MTTNELITITELISNSFGTGKFPLSKIYVRNVRKQADKHKIPGIFFDKDRKTYVDEERFWKFIRQIKSLREINKIKKRKLRWSDGFYVCW